MKSFKVSIFLILVLATYSLKAQTSLTKIADDYYNAFRYKSAISSYEQIIQNSKIDETTKDAVLYKLADSYMKVKDSENAERILTQMLGGSEAASQDPNIALKYAQVLATNAKYKDSEREYNRYLSIKGGSDEVASGFSKLYQDISVISKNARCYKVDYSSINTTASEFSPTLYKDGLIFVSNRTGGPTRRVFGWNDTPFLDLFYLDDVNKVSSAEATLGGSSSVEEDKVKKGSKMVRLVGSDEYTTPTPNDTKTLGSFTGGSITLGKGYGDTPITESERMTGSINSKYHEGPSMFFKDGNKVIFTRNNVVGSKARKSTDGVIKLKLLMSTFDGKAWSKPTELPFNSDEYSTGHPTLSPDESAMYFVSDMPGGFGGTDLYKVDITGDSFSTPENLGREVNTTGNEMFPFMDPSGSLYFSSNGHPGLGDLDIFFLQSTEGSFNKKPINLGAPINSGKDDFGILTDALREKGYFSSNRKNGGDDDDIYRFVRECDLEEECALLVAVFDADSKDPLENATVTYIDSEGTTQTFKTDEDGKAELKGIQTSFKYNFTANLGGYKDGKVAYTTEECDNEISRIEIPLSKTNPTSSDSTITNEDGTVTVINPGEDFKAKNFDNATKCLLIGFVKQQNDNKVIPNAEVTLINKCDGSTLKTNSDDNGEFRFNIIEGCDYTLAATADGLAHTPFVLADAKCTEGGVKADLLMFKSGDVVKIENIYFDYGKYSIRPDARIELDKLVEIMRKYPKMKIDMGSHTDSRSSSAFNQRLSENRAKSSAEYLLKRGITRSRVTYKGYGESQLTNGCADGVACDEVQHQANRRTEFRVVQLN